MNIDNKKILIGAGVVIVVYLLYKKSQSKVNQTQYSKECYDSLQSRLMQEDVKPPNFEKDFLERCQKITNEANLQIKNKSNNLGATPMPQLKNQTIEEQRASAIIYYKTLPDSFTIDNVNYTKNSNLEFYKTPFIPNSFSGVQPIKISGAEFSDAYIKFKNQDLPKSSFLDSFIKDGGVIYN
jgi:hypothetical protein